MEVVASAVEAAAKVLGQLRLILIHALEADFGAFMRRLLAPDLTNIVEDPRFREILSEATASQDTLDVILGSFAVMGVTAKIMGQMGMFSWEWFGIIGARIPFLLFGLMRWSDLEDSEERAWRQLSGSEPSREEFQAGLYFWLSRILTTAGVIFLLAGIGLAALGQPGAILVIGMAVFVIAFGLVLLTMSLQGGR